jgi:glutamate/tyrosine decarboxylase-like PLP-dependent enzyme
MSSISSRGELLRVAAERAIAYLDGLDARPVQPSRDALDRLRLLDQPLPDGPTDPGAVLRLLDEVGSPATVASAGGRFFGFVIGGSLPAAAAASWLATAWDQNAFSYVTSPVASALERAALRHIVDVLSLPQDWCGGLVTGTTMAHVASLAAARHAVLARVGWDVERDGLAGAPPITVIAGEGAHATLDKALRLLGLGTGRVVRVATDVQGRMIPGRIPVADGPTIVCAQTGHVDGGACDPLPDVLDVARRMNAWTHVDAAFGLWARAAPRRAHLVAGLEGVDSCAADLHKWLNVPYDSGVYLVRGSAERDVRAVLEMHGAYFPAEHRHDPARFTPESSRRARGVDAWAALLSLGRSGLADLVERTCVFAGRLADGLAAAGYEALNEVQLNQVVVSFGDDATTRRVIEAIQEDGTCWCGGTTWHGRAAMRISVSSWATTTDDVERSLAAMLRIAGRLAPRAAGRP